jgi:hypothetical protein
MSAVAKAQIMPVARLVPHLNGDQLRVRAQRAEFARNYPV